MEVLLADLADDLLEGLLHLEQDRDRRPHHHGRRPGPHDHVCSEQEHYEHGDLGGLAGPGQLAVEEVSGHYEGREAEEPRRDQPEVVRSADLGGYGSHERDQGEGPDACDSSLGPLPLEADEHAQRHGHDEVLEFSGDFHGGRPS